MLIRVGREQPRVVELEGDGQFSRVMEDSEQIRRNAGRVDQRQRVKAIVQVASSRAPAKWYDVATWWEGYWRSQAEGGLPRADDREVALIGEEAVRRMVSNGEIPPAPRWQARLAYRSVI